jgi:3-dehydroquinate dehydratase-2
MKILILNGPNLNLLGKREPDMYGSATFEETLSSLKADFPDLDLSYFQSNHEGELIDQLQQVESGGFSGLLINPGAFSHYSYALRDALLAVPVPKAEVHISNIYKRESFRQTSVTAAACDGLISGFGRESYHIALFWLKSRLTSKG